MGKPYSSELEKLSLTYEWALRQPISELEDFTRDASVAPLYSIGSGGSLTAAAFASTLHRYIGMTSSFLTPLEFIGQRYIPRNISVLIFSARGRNHDVLASFSFAAKNEPRNLLAICTDKDTPLGRLTRMYQFGKVVEYSLPTRKDGFLATNSLLGSMILIWRSYASIFGLESKMASSLQALINPTSSEEKFGNDLRHQIKELLGKNTIIVLFDTWTKPVALDIESKLSESGLVNVQLADLRNFAHGRHNWLDKKQIETGIIALVSTDGSLATETLALIPKNIPRIRLDAQNKSPLASLELLTKIMHIVALFGEAKGIDPGRPDVPSYGSKIYNLRFTKSGKRNAADISSTAEEVAISRKIGMPTYLLSNDDLELWWCAHNNFISELRQTKYNGIIFDYDGTLCAPESRFSGISPEVAKRLLLLLSNDIFIGVATGRGKSVRKDLQAKIPRKFWNLFLIGYYNCSDISNLADETSPDLNREMSPDLNEIRIKLISDKIFRNMASIEIRPRQITVEPMKHSALDYVYNYTNNLLGKYFGSEVNMLKSTHTIDILPSGASKLNLVRTLATHVKGSDASILKIGDKGRKPGNDYYLLSMPNSLSVDEVSSDPNSCWNLSPTGWRGVQALNYYLNALSLKEGHFYIEL